MKNTGYALVTSLFLLAGWSSAGAEETASIDMHLMSSGAMPKIGGYMPRPIKLSDQKPDDLKKAPELSSPLYGTIEFGGHSHLVVLDEPVHGDPVLYVDANGNGDLTDDPATTWTKEKYTGAGGRELVRYQGHFKLPLAGEGKGEMVNLSAYRFDKEDPQRAALKDILFYYADYARDGQVSLGGQKYHAMLIDMGASGDFHGQPKGEGAPAGPAPQLLIDLNGDGRFDPRNEIYDPHKPFNIKGTTWEVTDLKPDGSFQITKSDKTVAEVAGPPDLSPGKDAIAFTAKTMNGKKVDFPKDYKGKVVLLDFWATWCGPCMGEVPGLVKTYNKYHPKGLEVLGISLDQPNAANEVKKVTADKHMTWPQVYDGKFWQAEIAQLYGIESIPAPILVDGDTGKIIASGESLRGDELEPTLKKALDAHHHASHGPAK